MKINVAFNYQYITCDAVFEEGASFKWYFFIELF